MLNTDTINAHDVLGTFTANHIATGTQTVGYVPTVVTPGGPLVMSPGGSVADEVDAATRVFLYQTFV